MTRHATIDFETYSEAGFEWDAANKKWTHPEGGSPTNRGLNLVGAVNYTRHPSFAVLCGWYRLPGGELSYWDPSMPPPQDLFDHVAAGGTVEAHNHAFERRVFEALGWPAVPLAQQRCSMAKGRAWALPGSLGDASAVTGTRAKNPDGKRGIQLFCMPQKPTKANGQKTRLTREDRPEEFQRLIVDYCADDVRAEEALSEITPELSPIELEHWFVDQTINSRGVAVDVPTLQAMREVLRDAQKVYGDRCRAVTGGISPSEVSQLISWAAGHGVYFDALDDDALTEALDRENLPQPVRAMLQCRAAVASASVKKVHAMLNRATTEGRIYDLFNFHAARTGRPTGDKVQPTNMPRGSSPVLQCGCKRWHYSDRCPWCNDPRPNGKPDEWSPDAMHDAIEILQTGSLPMVERAYGDALTAMASCLRGMFVAAEGYDLVSSDYTAIEAVVLACLAGEKWRIDLFHAKGKIYEASGAKVGGVTYQSLIDYKKETGKHHPLRQVGKTAELGLGFMGWIGAWLAFDSSGSRSEAEIKEIILKWRAENPAIVEFWGGQVRREGWNKRDDLHGVEGSFIQAAMRPGSRVEYRGLVFESRIPDFPARCPAVALSAPLTVSITLLSGRKLTYHNVLLEPTDRPWNGTYSVSYEGFNTNPKSGPRGWIRHRTHGGKLCIAEGTPVLTLDGWKEIEYITPMDRVWDGVDWVTCGGAVCNGEKPTISAYGAQMTHDHEVLTEQGWKHASESERYNRADAGIPDGFGIPRQRRPQVAVGHGLRVREDHRDGLLRVPKAAEAGGQGVVRLHEKPVYSREADYARHEHAFGLRRVAVHESPLYQSKPCRLEKLRRARNIGLPSLARIVRELLVRHGADLRPGPRNRPEGQRLRVFPGELPLGNFNRPEPQSPRQRPNAALDRRRDSRIDGFIEVDGLLPAEARGNGGADAGGTGRPQKVFDVLNCGPRNRFTIWAGGAGLIVHNCENIVQATANDILRYALANLERAGYATVLHVYDEIVCEVPKGWGSVAELESIMADLPAWAKGWPIAADGGWRGKRYRKG